MGIVVLEKQPNCLVVALPRECSNFDDGDLRDAEKRILDLLAAPGRPTGVVFDLSRTEFLGTLFIEFVLRVAKEARQRGGEVIVAGLHGRVREVFETTKLDTLLPAADSVEEAIDRIQQSGGTQA